MVSRQYQLDPLLPRTVLASLGHQYIDLILASDTHLPIDAILAMVYFHYKKGHISTYKLEVCKNLLYPVTHV